MALSVQDVSESAFLLPDSVVELLIDEYPKSYPALARVGLKEELALKLADKKMSADDTRNLCWTQSEKVLAHMAATERRRGPLDMILHRVKLGADLQKKISGRKLHEDVLQTLIQQGVTLETAERLWRKNDLSSASLVMLLEVHGDKFDVELLAAALSTLLNFSVFAGQLAARRPDVREAILNQERITGSWGIVASVMLTTKEQEHIVTRLDNNPPSLAVAAAMLDRPTTTMAVREALWDEYSDRFDQLGWVVAPPQVWPEVSNMGLLDAASQHHFLQREVSPPWKVTRAIQVAELLVTASGERHTVSCWRHLNIATGQEQRFRVGLAWMKPFRSAKANLAYTVDRLAAETAARTERAQWAEGFTGVQEQQAPGRFMLGADSEYEPDGNVHIKDFRRWETDTIHRASAYLAQELGDNRNAWRVAFEMLPEFPGTIAKLTQLALAASN